MGNRTFNIDDDVYTKFSELYKGDMSKIINDFIKDFVQMGEASQDIIELENQLRENEQTQSSLKLEHKKLKFVLDQKRQEALEKEEEAKEVNKSVREWAKDIITDAKRNKSYTDLALESEKLGFNSVEDYLIDKWEKGAK